MRSLGFWGLIVAALLAGGAFAGFTDNEYYFTAAYAILQALIMAVAWNILGGFTGYVNFGSAGFFALAAYSSVALHKFLPSIGFDAPLVVYILAAAGLCGLIGLGTGYLTLRLRGVYFAIATSGAGDRVPDVHEQLELRRRGQGHLLQHPDPRSLGLPVLHELCEVPVRGRCAAGADGHRGLAPSSAIPVGRGLAAIRDDEPRQSAWACRRSGSAGLGHRDGRADGGRARPTRSWCPSWTRRRRSRWRSPSMPSPCP
jgi:branched-chain amino acid transport system permease protein